jgi:hypothetical protein
MGGYASDSLQYNDVWQSTDGGISWTSVLSNAEWIGKSSLMSSEMSLFCVEQDFVSAQLIMYSITQLATVILLYNSQMDPYCY